MATLVIELGNSQNLHVSEEEKEAKKKVTLHLKISIKMYY